MYKTTFLFMLLLVTSLASFGQTKTAKVTRTVYQTKDQSGKALAIPQIYFEVSASGIAINDGIHLYIVDVDSPVHSHISSNQPGVRTHIVLANKNTLQWFGTGFTLDKAYMYRLCINGETVETKLVPTVEKNDIVPGQSPFN